MADPFLALGPPRERVNVAEHLLAHAAAAPEQEAIVERNGRARRSCTFAELAARTARLASGLEARGVRPGDRVAVFIPPGQDLIAVVWALLRMGALPVLADPGMGRERLLGAIERTAPRVLIGIRRALLARALFRGPFRSVELAFSVGPRLPFRAVPLERVEAAGTPDHQPFDAAAESPAAILFTSGSTGPPKGVRSTHGMLDAQVRALREALGFRPGERDLCGLPAFALFDAALGLTSIFPPVDPARPATADPAALLAVCEEERATTAFLSPALWRRLVPWMEAEGRRFSTLKRATSAGAPLPVDIARRLRALLPTEGGELFTPYGATEGLPVCVIDGATLEGHAERIAAGAGTPVGAAAPGIELAIAEVTDGPLEGWTREQALPLGRVGEVLVRGPAITQEYDAAPEATRLAKVPHEGGGPAWHRMGDLGRLDDDGCLWFLGRKSHRVETEQGMLAPVELENVFLTSPLVERCALVGVGPRGRELPVLVVEPAGRPVPRGEHETAQFITALRRTARTTPRTAGIKRFLFHPSLPVDPRHNSKIHREELKAWAEEQLGVAS